VSATAAKENHGGRRERAWAGISSSSRSRTRTTGLVLRKAGPPLSWGLPTSCVSVLIRNDAEVCQSGVLFSIRSDST
jgi:hypothetical protein